MNVALRTPCAVTGTMSKRITCVIDASKCMPRCRPADASLLKMQGGGCTIYINATIVAESIALVVPELPMVSTELPPDSRYYIVANAPSHSTILGAALCFC